MERERERYREREMERERESKLTITVQYIVNCIHMYLHYIMQKSQLP